MPPTCLGELSSDHRCDTNDIVIARHTSTVRNVLRSTPLLDTIQSAHAHQRNSTEKPEPINMGPDFFLDAGGQDGSDDDSASADAESHHSSESEDGYEQQDQSGNSGDDSSPPPSPFDDEDHDWE
jgi:hypothetical protein